MGSDGSSLPVLVGLCWLQSGLGEDVYAEARDRWKGRLPASAGPLCSNQARLLPTRLMQESQGLRRRLLLLREAPYMKTEDEGAGTLYFSPVEDVPMMWDTSFHLPPHSAVQGTGKKQTGFSLLSAQREETTSPSVSPGTQNTCKPSPHCDRLLLRLSWPVCEQRQAGARTLRGL